jgi:hypothetical protein
MTTMPAPTPVISQRTSLVVLALALLTVVGCWKIPPANAGNETGVLMDLPDDIGSLEGVPQAISQAEHEILPPDTTFARKSYAPFNIDFSDNINRIMCSIVLSGREKRSIHRPERCLPGQGWTVIGSNIIDVPLDSGHPLKVTALLLSRPLPMQDGTTRTLQSYYLYWYVGRTVSTPYSFVRVMLTNWDLVVHRFNQRWAYIIVTKPITGSISPQGMTADQTLAQLKDFIRAAAPSFVKSEMPAASGSTASR